MDERLIRIFNLVHLLNLKGKNISLSLYNKGLNIYNHEGESLIPHWTKCIYFDDFWTSSYDDMVNGALEMLKNMLRGAENE